MMSSNTQNIEISHESIFSASNVSPKREAGPAQLGLCEPDELVAHRERDKLVAHHEHDKLVAQHEPDKLVAHHEPDKLVTHREHDKLVAHHETDKLVTHHEHDKLVTHHEPDKLVDHREPSPKIEDVQVSLADITPVPEIDETSVQEEQSSRSVSLGPKKRKRSSVSSFTHKKRPKNTASRLTISKIHRADKPIFSNTEYQDWRHFDASCNVYVIGSGNVGQIGLGEDCDEVIKPTKVEIEANQSFKQVACGGMHSLALSMSGVVYSAGCNDEGALGREATCETECLFQPVTALKTHKIVKVCAGDSYSAALTTEGDVYAWGLFRDVNGPIGLLDDKIKTEPTLVYRNEDVCTNIAGGNNHLIILTSKGRIFTCGSGDAGQLGRMTERDVESRGGRKGVKSLVTPQEVFLPVKSRSKSSFGGFSKNAVKIFSTKLGSFAVTLDGSVYGWGLNNNGQVYPSEEDVIYHPILLKYLNSTCGLSDCNFDFVIDGGVDHTLVLNRSQKRIFSFGSSRFGILGRYVTATGYSEVSPENAIKPIELDTPDVYFVDCACGDNCSHAISNRGQLYSWGMGVNNQLGVGAGEDVMVPALVKSESLRNVKVIRVSSGSQHSALLCC